MATSLSLVGKSVTSISSTYIEPSSGVSRPAMHLRVEVFPHPDGPSRTRNSWSLISRETPLTASVLPYRFVRFSILNFDTEFLPVSVYDCLKPFAGDLRTTLYAPGATSPNHQM